VITLSAVTSEEVCESLRVALTGLDVTVEWLGDNLQRARGSLESGAAGAAHHGYIVELTEEICSEQPPSLHSTPGIGDIGGFWAGLAISHTSASIASRLGITTLISQQSELETWLEGLSDLELGASAPGDAPAEGGRIIAVWGPHGSPGATTLSLTMAAALSVTTAHVVLVDAHTYGPAISLALGLSSPSPGLLGATRMARVSGVSAGTILESAVRYTGRVSSFLVLTGLLRPDKHADIEQGALQRVLETLRDAGHSVVIDCAPYLERLSGEVLGGPIRNSATLTVLGFADHVIVVTKPSPLATQRLARVWSQFVESAAKATYTVCSNGVGPKDSHRAEEAAYALWQLCGIEKVHPLPLDADLIQRAESEGVTLVDLPKKGSLLVAVSALISAELHISGASRPVRARVASQKPTRNNLWNTLLSKRLP
jgi:Mrp family chromosome partitioning ATPase